MSPSPQHTPGANAINGLQQTFTFSQANIAVTPNGELSTLTREHYWSL